MTLDLSRIIAGINALAANTEARRDETRYRALRDAWARLDSRSIEQRLVGAKTSFLVARTDSPAHAQAPEPQLPPGHAVIATDGSLVLPSRHSPARFYILNIGVVRLRYGDCPSALLEAIPSLHFGDDALTVPNDPRRTLHNETTLGLLRAVEELRAAIDLAVDEPHPKVVLQDGTLILWRLESQSDPVREWVLAPFVEQLRAFADHEIPLASYISAPASTDLMGSLRVAVCDYPDQGRTIDCDHCRARIATERHQPACDILPMLTDRALLTDIACLSPGARTPVYRSESRILREYVTRGGPELEIRFFYVHTGREIARVEAPRFVTDNPASLDLVHAVVLDQCRLGLGYPVALQEAHEQAVIGMEDRRIVERAVEEALARAGIVLTWTGKDGSKRGRFV